MTRLRQHIEQYLSLRRGLGFKLERAGRLLADFADFAEQAGTDTVTVDVAVAWARLPTRASGVWTAQRLGVVRGLARWLHTVDATAEIPPADLLSARTRRATPYLYSDAEIAALMAAARSLAHPLRAATFATLIGLLATTGMRASEAMRLDRGDIDPDQGLLTVRDTKFGKSRQLCVHSTALDALADYNARRDRLCPCPATNSVFVSSTGARLCHATIQPTFRRLLGQAGIGRHGSPRPRIHDLRHSFAVRTLLRWYQDGHDVQALLPALSTYLGHVNPGATYWYLSGSPQLLALAAERLETSVGRSS